MAAGSPGQPRAATQLEPRLRIGKVNTEEAPSLASALGIHSIPTLALFHRGREVARVSGAMDAARITQGVAPHL